MLATEPAIRDVLNALARNRVPLEMSVTFLLRWRGFGVQETAAAAGVGRIMFFQALRGDRGASDRIREAVSGRLGIDPWEVYAGYQDPPPGPRRERT